MVRMVMVHWGLMGHTANPYCFDLGSVVKMVLPDMETRCRLEQSETYLPKVGMIEEIQVS